MVLISFILNINSNKELIKKTLDSFSTQTIKDFEIIYCPNKLNNEENKLIKSYEKTSKLTISSKTNIIECIKEAKGEYITLFNTNTILSTTESLEKIINNIDKQSEIITGKITLPRQINTYNQFIYNYLTDETRKSQKNNLEEILYNLFLSNKLIKKTLLQQHNFDYEYVQEDKENQLLLEIISKTENIQVTHVDYIKLNPRTTPNQSSAYTKIFTNYKNLLELNQDNKITLPILEKITKNILKIKETPIPDFSETEYKKLENEINTIIKILKANNYTFTYHVKKLFQYIKEKTHSKVTNFEVAISVIIPTYNVENYIEDSINSILNQSFQDFEIIIVDDVSTDSTKNILKQYSEKDKRIRVIYSNEKSGSGGSRNIGLLHARGKYIQFLDGDDWLDLDTLKETYFYAEKYETQLVMFKGLNYNNSTKEFYKDEYFTISVLERFNNKVFGFDEIFDELFKIFVGPINKLYLKSYLDDIHAKFPKNVIHQDNPFFYQVFTEAEQIYLVDNYYYTRRVWTGSITSLRDNTELGTIEVVEEILKVFINNGLYERFKKPLLNRLMFKLRNRYNLVGLLYKDEYYSLVKAKLNKFMFEYGLYDDLVECLDRVNKKYFNSVIYTNDFDEFNRNY